MKFFIVEAFAEEAFGGNTAGVVILNEEGFPKDEVMVKIASELRYSETAFVREISEKRYEIRYFTPVAEVDLCGHATIGSFGALLSMSIISKYDNAIAETKAGNLEIKIENGKIFMEMASPEEKEDTINLMRLSKSLGIEMEDIVEVPAKVSTGLPDIIVGIRSRDALNNMKPNFQKMKEFTSNENVVGIHAYSLAEDENVTAFCRNFAPLFGIDEESATGTANGALTYYLYKRGIIMAEEDNLFIQGESMGRLSKIESKIRITDGEKVFVGGSAFVLAEGEIYI